MTNLREAAVAALEAYSLRDYEFGKYMEALRAALAEPVQEPVAWMYEDTLPKEYPYDAMWPHSAVRDGVRMFPVFAPPQRKPLTEEEIEKAYRHIWRSLPDDFDHTTASWIEQGIRYAEQAHGIK